MPRGDGCFADHSVGGSSWWIDSRARLLVRAHPGVLVRSGRRGSAEQSVGIFRVHRPPGRRADKAFGVRESRATVRVVARVSGGAEGGRPRRTPEHTAAALATSAGTIPRIAWRRPGGGEGVGARPRGEDQVVHNFLLVFGIHSLGWRVQPANDDSVGSTCLLSLGGARKGQTPWVVSERGPVRW